MGKTLPEEKTITTRKFLKFDLDPAEIEAKRAKSLELEEKIEEQNNKIKEYTKNRKAEIKGITDERKLLHAQIKSGKEERDVKCQEVYNYKAGTVTTRYDGKDFGVRAMSDSERQEPLPLKGGEPLTKADFEDPKEVKSTIKMETNKRTKHDASTSPN